MNWIAICVMTLALTLGNANTSQAVIIDDFNDTLLQTANDTVIGGEVSSGGLTQSQIQGAGGIVIGAREIFANKTAGSDGLAIQGLVSGDAYNHSQAAGTIQVEGLTRIEWTDFNDAAGSVDLTGSTIRVSVLTVDQLGGDLTFDLFDGVGTSSLTVAIAPTAPPAYDLFFPAALFSAGANLAAINEIHMTIDGQGVGGLDLTVDIVEAVPVPATLVLLGVGLVVGGAVPFWAGRRKAKVS